MKQKFGHLYENLNLKRGKMVILEPITFLLRRALLAYIVIYPIDLAFQFFVFVFTVFWQVFLINLV